MYGSDYVVTDVKINEDGTDLIVSYKEQGDKVINLIELLVKASSTSAGLMSAEDKINLDKLVAESGQIDSKVEELKTSVANLEASIDNVDKKVDAIDLTPYATTVSVNEALEGYVSKIGYVAYSQEEKNKLATIEEGAQINVIEKVIFNGEEIAVDASTKSVTLNTPLDVVRGLADGEKFLSLDEATGKLGTTVGLTYYTNTEGETPVYEIRLTGKNGEVVSSIDAKSFVKDGMLDDVKLVVDPENQISGTYLVFTWNTESGVSEPMYVPVTDLVDVYTAGDGISIDDNVVKVKVKSGDPYLEVTAEGVASKGIDAAITTAKNDVVGSESDSDAANTIYGAKKYAANLVAAHEGSVNAALDSKVNVESYNEFVEQINTALSKITVTDVDTNASNGVNLVKSDAGIVDVTVNVTELGAALVGAAGETGAVAGTTVKLGEAVTSDGEEIISAGSTVHAAIQTLAGQIQSAVAGGITGVSGDEYIKVGGTTTSKSLTLDVTTLGSYMADGSSAIKANNGKLTLEWETVE